jgi:hypothetical protein
VACTMLLLFSRKRRCLQRTTRTTSARRRVACDVRNNRRLRELQIQPNLHPPTRHASEAAAHHRIGNQHDVAGDTVPGQRPAHARHRDVGCHEKRNSDAPCPGIAELAAHLGTSDSQRAPSQQAAAALAFALTDPVKKHTPKNQDFVVSGAERG